MTNSNLEEINKALLKNRRQFQHLIEEKLRNTPLDYADQFQMIKNTWKDRNRHLAAGVFLLLQYGQHSSATEKEPSFLLIKRSSLVAQSGDISCPGGMFNSFLDPLISFTSLLPFSPLFKGESLYHARQRDVRTFRTILLFLANAARESWEEIGLSPFNISFLGALPTYSLRLFKRTIFPVVGLIRHHWHYKPNTEVDKIIEIPVSAFFTPDNYSRCYINSENSFLNTVGVPSHFPCLILKQKDDTEEILWGATFNIITNFLNIVFDQSLPTIPEGVKTIVKACPDNYFRGNSK